MKKIMVVWVFILLLTACGGQKETPQLEAGSRTTRTPRTTVVGPTPTPAPTSPPMLIDFAEGETAVVLTSAFSELKTQLEAVYLPIAVEAISNRDAAIQALARHNAYVVMWGDETAVYFETIASSDQGRFFIPSYEHTSFVIERPSDTSHLYRFTVGMLYYLKQRYTRTLFELERIEAAYDAVAYLRAMSHYKERQFEKAITEFDRVTGLNPNFYGAYCNRVVALMQLPREMWDTSAMFGALTHAIGLEPDNAFAYAVRGQLHIFMGDSESAVADFLEYQYLAGDEADPRVAAAIEQLTAPPPSPTPPPERFSHPDFPDGMVFQLPATSALIILKQAPGVLRDSGICLNTQDITVLQSVQHYTGVWVEVGCGTESGWLREVEIKIK